MPRCPTATITGAPRTGSRGTGRAAMPTRRPGMGRCAERNSQRTPPQNANEGDKRKDRHETTTGTHDYSVQRAAAGPSRRAFLVVQDHFPSAFRVSAVLSSTRRILPFLRSLKSYPHSQSHTAAAGWSTTTPVASNHGPAAKPFTGTVLHHAPPVPMLLINKTRRHNDQGTNRSSTGGLLPVRN